jgi:hypothetical protein
MQALTLPARRGWRWLSEGFGIFSKNRLMLSLAVLGYWMLMVLINSFPQFSIPSAISSCRLISCTRSTRTPVISNVIRLALLGMKIDGVHLGAMKLVFLLYFSQSAL